MTAKQYLRKRFGKPVGEGMSRTVFASTHVVFKVAKTPRGNGTGEDDNYSEFVTYRKALKCPKQYIPVAKCRLIRILGEEVLMMEKVEDRNLGIRNYPQWVYSVDCSQVGFTRTGKLVAYDYA